MSVINKSKTVMISPILQSNKEELLIQARYILKEDTENEKSYFAYEKLKHNIKKKLREKLMDDLASKIVENESQKNINVLSSLNTKSDSKGIYHRLKKINQSQNESHELKNCFINWLYKTPNALAKLRIKKISKADRLRKINIGFYRYQNSLFSNIGKKTTDMTSKTTRNKIQIPINLKMEKKPRYKYNYSCNNSKISYSKPVTDPNKGNIYIGKKNGEHNHYLKKYNNFGSLTIIQHNVDSTKKYKNYQNNGYIDYRQFWPRASRNKKNNLKDEAFRTMKNNRSYHNFFYHTFTQRNNEENIENGDLRN